MCLKILIIKQFKISNHFQMHIFVENIHNFDLKTKRIYIYQLVYIKVSGSFLFNNIAICVGKIVIYSRKRLQN